ncbi:MAG: hypothetical protein ABUL54_04945 [Dongia sp.]
MTRTLILAAALAVLAVPALADQVGAPGSAAGGVQTEPLTPPSSSLPSAAGPLGTSPAIRPSDRLPSPDLPPSNIEPGTGKYKAPPGVPCSTFIGRDHNHC